MFPETVETESLTLRPLSSEYVDPVELYECLGAGAEGADEVYEYLPQSPYSTVKEAHDALADAEAEWADRESAKYAAFRDGEVSGSDRPTGGEEWDRSGGRTLVGVAGLALDWDRRTAMPGVILAPPFWGRGYAGECARALADLAFERLDLDLFALSYDGDNERSRRAIERFVDEFGGRREGTLRNWTPVDGAVLDGTRYTVTRKEYRAATRKGSGDDE